MNCGFLVYLKLQSLLVNELMYELEKPHDAIPNYQTTGRTWSARTRDGHVVVNLHFDLHLNIAPEEAVG